MTPCPTGGPVVTDPDHYREAERLALAARCQVAGRPADHPNGQPMLGADATEYAALAQVHATLAVAAGCRGGTDSAAPPAAVELVADALAEVRAELSRVDGKAAALLGLASAGLALVLARASGAAVPVPVAVAVWAAAGCMSAGVAVLLRVLAPRLRPCGGADPAGSLSWVGYVRVADLAAHLAEVATSRGPAGWRADRTRELSAIVAGKYRRLAAAVWLLLSAVGFLGLAAAATAVTR